MINMQKLVYSIKNKKNKAKKLYIVPLNYKFIAIEVHNNIPISTVKSSLSKICKQFKDYKICKSEIISYYNIIKGLALKHYSPNLEEKINKIAQLKREVSDRDHEIHILENKFTTSNDIRGNKIKYLEADLVEANKTIKMLTADSKIIINRFKIQLRNVINCINRSLEYCKGNNESIIDLYDEYRKYTSNLSYVEFARIVKYILGSDFLYMFDRNILENVKFRSNMGTYANNLININIGNSPVNWIYKN